MADRAAIHRVALTRASVAASDDIDAPHPGVLTFDPPLPLADVLQRVADAGYLASIAGGEGCWVAVSRRPFAVIAQQWSAPRFLSSFGPDPASLAFEGDTLRLHLSYLAQADPALVARLLGRIDYPVE